MRFFHFLPIFLVAVLASSGANAQLPSASGLMLNLAGRAAGSAAKSAGGAVMKSIFGDGKPKLEEGLWGTSMYNAVIDLPGSKRLVPNTLYEGARLINNLQKDVKNLIMGMVPFDTSKMNMQEQGAIAGAITMMQGIYPALEQQINGMITRMSSLSGITELPMVLTGEAMSLTGRMLSGFTTMIMNGAGVFEVMSNTFSNAQDLFWAIFKDSSNSPMAITRIVVRPFVPMPLKMML